MNRYSSSSHAVGRLRCELVFLCLLSKLCAFSVPCPLPVDGQSLSSPVQKHEVGTLNYIMPFWMTFRISTCLMHEQSPKHDLSQHIGYFFAAWTLCLPSASLILFHCRRRALHKRVCDCWRESCYSFVVSHIQMEPDGGIFQRHVLPRGNFLLNGRRRKKDVWQSELFRFFCAAGRKQMTYRPLKFILVLCRKCKRKIEPCSHLHQVVLLPANAQIISGRSEHYFRSWTSWANGHF